MTDLECVEYAVRVVLFRCDAENPQRIAVPCSGAEVMEFFADALTEARKIRDLAP